MEDRKFHISLVNADGTERFSLLDADPDDSGFSVCPRSGSIVLADARSGSGHIWRVDASGRNLTSTAIFTPSWPS